MPKGPVRRAVCDVGGWVADSGDIREIALALLQVIDYVDESQDTSGRICSAYREQFDSARVADEYQAVISELTIK
jgi:glycosyltransferase involved in cell wall biosynthesis